MQNNHIVDYKLQWMAKKKMTVRLGFYHDTVAHRSRKRRRREKEKKVVDKSN